MITGVQTTKGHIQTGAETTANISPITFKLFVAANEVYGQRTVRPAKEIDHRPRMNELAARLRQPANPVGKRHARREVLVRAVLLGRMIAGDEAVAWVTHEAPPEVTGRRTAGQLASGRVPIAADERHPLHGRARALGYMEEVVAVLMIDRAHRQYPTQ